MQAQTGIALAWASGQDVLVPWGLGDHGGGPTREDLEKFRVLFAEMENPLVVKKIVLDHCRINIALSGSEIKRARVFVPRPLN